VGASARHQLWQVAIGERGFRREWSDGSDGRQTQHFCALTNFSGAPFEDVVFRYSGIQVFRSCGGLLAGRRTGRWRVLSTKGASGNLPEAPFGEDAGMRKGATVEAGSRCVECSPSLIVHL